MGDQFLKERINSSRSKLFPLRLHFTVSMEANRKSQNLVPYVKMAEKEVLNSYSLCADC